MSRSERRDGGQVTSGWTGGLHAAQRTKRHRFTPYQWQLIMDGPWSEVQRLMKQLAHPSQHLEATTHEDLSNTSHTDMHAALSENGGQIGGELQDRKAARRTKRHRFTPYQWQLIMDGPWSEVQRLMKQLAHPSQHLEATTHKDLSNTSHTDMHAALSENGGQIGGEWPGRNAAHMTELYAPGWVGSNAVWLVGPGSTLGPHETVPSRHFFPAECNVYR
ncbi:hypothetical protein CALCODRAFT_510287 [Calocera cornea HHB12733]|uniref:Uncharacterized protein n=1 Tax=Calocera cornea HHB12733 TaxID=1353952 RepID=A0A165EM57_9BASI|nr:hypothetical protein CALCODRAFT_510287 [Calocera cornea HHB12733]